MSEDWETSPSEERAQTTDWPKEALTPIVSVSGSESSSNFSMERLLQEVRAFVVRSDSGAAKAATQHEQP